MRRPTIVLFGDSITEESFGDGGWGASLANHFCRSADVLMRGYSGYNTRWALRVAEKVFGGFESPPPAAVTVFFGANDACLPDRSGAFQHVPVEEYRLNLLSLLQLIRSRWPTTILLLITPPPIDEDGRLRFPYADDRSGLPERTNAFAGTYRNACIDAAEELAVPVVDLWTKMQRFPGWEKNLLRDGLHLTAEGNRVVFEEVVERLREQGVSVDAMAVDLPLFSQMDVNDPLKSFSN
ncbi:GDSL esterase/lipase [Acorus gramineus]|uniref:GDSL esterase/lipase n=1 Tax=Acorus gramineus TaxID=55184 RepID=A0AAV9AX12_ACOGR|nr:GDSL esterase/lipase [Acorus gramineus]